MTRYVGFYWTLPVPFVGFTALPGDVDGAAKRSRTVRYQVDRVRRWVKEQKGDLVAERAFLELEPDRGTAEGAQAAAEAISLARKEHATLVLVDFAEAFGWRRHTPLREAVEASGVPHMILPPDPVAIDGREFDPVAHFRTWSDVWAQYRSSKPARKAQLKDTIRALAHDDMTFAELACALNARGIPTITGKLWTKDSVRKFVESA